MMLTGQAAASAGGSGARTSKAPDPKSSTAADVPMVPPARLLARANSERIGLTPTTTLRQSSSIRALLRLASTPDESTVHVAPIRTPTPPRPVRQARSARRNVVAESTPLLRRSITTGQIPPLVRAMSSYLGLPHEEEKFRCNICFDDVPVSEAVTLTSCGHRYCESCFESYLEIKIREGNVYPVCFHPLEREGDDAARKTCGVAVDVKQIERIVEPEIWKKFNLFRFNKEHEHARECPHCAFSQDCTGPENPECVCEECGKTFCFFHDNAHEGGTCADYELQNAETESLNRAKIKEISKPCPGCSRDVEKDGGCNHMKCVVCDTSLCWLCGEIIEDAPMPSHYDSSSGGGCSGRQFDEDSQVELPWPVRVYAVFVAALCYPFAFLFAVVSAPFGWCSSSSDQSFSDMFWFRHMMAMIWLALVVSLVFFLVAIVLELTVRLVVFFIALPFVLIKSLALKLFCCCRPRAGATSLQSEVDERNDDLEAGHHAQPLKSEAESAAPVHAAAA